MRRLAALISVVLLGVLPGAEASVMRPTTPESLTREATVVLRGEVTATVGKRADAGRRIFTLATVSVAKVLKGEAPETVELVLAGGTVDGRTQRVMGAPVLEVGQTVVLFLRPAKGPARAVPRYRLSNWRGGAWTVAEGLATAWTRGQETLEVQTGPVTDTPAPVTRLPLDTLEQRILGAVE